MASPVDKQTRYEYAPLSSSQATPDESLSRQPTPVADDTSSQRNNREPLGIGKQKSKPTFPTTDFLVFVASLACLFASIVVVNPHWPAAGHLGFTWQIVLVGFILSIMNLCLNKLTKTFLLLVEVQWGGSTLQVYDAILTNSPLVKKIGIYWRVTIILLQALPLALSAGYKQFTGGTSTIKWNNTFQGRYGIAAPPLGDYTTMNNSVYFTISANVPFLAASSDDSVPPPTIPTAYGFNTLLLDSTSAALLDMPLPDYISLMQQRLTGSDSWKVSAAVNATVARYNASIETHRRQNDPFFNTTLNATSSWYGGYTSFFSFNAFALGWLTSVPTARDGSYALVGHYYWYPYFWDAYASDPSDPHFIEFQQAALMFNVRRERCAGTWQINRTAVVLLNGSCSGIPTDQSVVSSEIPFPLDALPVLNHALLSYAAGNSELSYPPTEEVIESTKATLDATRLLYIILAVQPVLALLMFLFIWFSYSTPIGDDFGIVAILSGADRDSLDLLSGAALSGKLERSVKLHISVEDEASDIPEKSPPEPGRIRYTIIDSTSKITELKNTGRIQRKRTYK